MNGQTQNILAVAALILALLIIWALWGNPLPR